jgi:hypothetical protein
LNIDDAVRQLLDLKATYGNLPVRCAAKCAHDEGLTHIAECFEEAYIEVREFRPAGLVGTFVRTVVID